MSRTFYLLTYFDEEEMEIGTRGGFGLYCNNCDISLVTKKRGGTDIVNPRDAEKMERLSECPACKSELNVVQAWSFSFAMNPLEVAKLPPGTWVVDENGNRYEMHEFRKLFIDGARFLFTPEFLQNLYR